MFAGRDNPRGRGATPLALAMLLGVVLGLCRNAVAAEPPTPPPTAVAPPGAAPADAGGPTAAETLAAYQAVESWIRAWSVPSDPQPSPTRRPACVTLRLAGRVVGRAADFSDDGAALWRAARGAFLEAAPNLPVERDALRAQRTLETAARLTIDVQLAGTLEPLVGETFAAAGAALSPGLDGVAARVGGTIAGVFPGAMLSSGRLPDQGLRVAAGELGLPPLDLEDLRAKHGLTVYRFAARHIAQPSPGVEPMFLTRGGRVVSTAEIGGPYLRGLSNGLARHLLKHAWPGKEPHGLLGDYNPLLNEFEPLIAPPFEQALAAIALARFAAAPGVDADLAKRCGWLARRVVEDLADVTPQETDPMVRPLDAAAWLLAQDLAPGPAGSKDLSATVEKARARVLGCAGSDAQWREHPPFARAFMAWALAEHAAQAGSPESFARAAEQRTRELWTSTAPAEFVDQMPWLAWAELRLARGKPDVPAGVALRSVRADIARFQVREDDAGADADLIGGIRLGIGGPPTWQSLRPAALLATMLGDARLTEPDELSGELSTLIRSLRFLAQLTIREPEGHMARDPSRALGGVRLALWDQRQPLGANALALLTLCDTLDALRARAGGK
ncbi:MAG: hypothetical protein IBJ11_07465 [Phycisphaerales bacterium]|nr:hypothetical protein [Phycisphaerales bacterium]